MLFFRAKDNVRHVDSVVVFDETADFFHAVSFRHVLRRIIVVADYRINLVCAQIFKRVVFAGDRRFRSVTFMKVVGVE